MDQHYSQCEKHKELFWHTITWGEECPLCKLEPQNLPKADAYSLLVDVRAWIEKSKNSADHYCVDVEVVRVEKLDDFLFKYISEHFS